MSKNVNEKTSVRQLPVGQMENLRKKFESVSENTKPPVSPKKVPKPVSSTIASPNNEQGLVKKRTENVLDRNSDSSPKKVLPQVRTVNKENEKGSEFQNLREQILQKSNRDSCPVSKLVQNFDGDSQNSVGLKTVKSDNDLSAVQYRPNFSRVSPSRPVSVAERTKMFEKRSSIEEDSVFNSTTPSITTSSPSKVRSKITSEIESNQKDLKPTPTARPRSRPPSSEIDAKDLKPTPPIRPRSRPPSQAFDDVDNTTTNEYIAVWETGAKITSSPNAPPVKPPRTGAHDIYTKLKLKKVEEKEDNKSIVGEHQYESVPDDMIKTPVYNRINKKESFGNSDQKRPLKPNRPPPPRDRPYSTPFPSSSFNGKDRPLPKRPGEPAINTDNASPLYEELNNTNFDLGKIKHWDLPQDELPPGGSLKRSYSAECLSRDSLFDDPVYVDPLKVNFRDDTDFDVYIDPSGYAVPYRHKRLQQTASTPIKPPKPKLHRQISLDSQPMKELKGKLCNLRKKIFHPEGQHSRDKKEFDISKNKKKLQSVKMKINIAFAIMRKGKKTEQEGQDDSHAAETNSSESDSLIDEREIEKRKDYCSVVRKNTAKKRKDNMKSQAVTYPQLFDFALIVGLEPMSDEGGYRPYIVYKFPEQLTRLQIESNISIPQFCFPDALEFDVKTASPAAPSESFSFVLTNFDGQHVYGYCKRLVPIDTPAGLPEVICIVSPVDAFSMYNDLLDEIEMKRQVSLTMAKELIVASFGRPLPDPGKMVHVRTLDENWETGTIFLARPSDVRVDNANRETLLSKLGVDKLIKLFSVMLLERSVLFCAKNLGILSQTVHAMRSLLYPFSWPHTYIPVLPDTMLDICCSPTPYIIGILSSHLQKVLNLPLSEVFIFDLDKRQVIKSQGDEDTLLPKTVQKALRTVLNMCKVEGDLKNAQNLLISEAFLRFFVEAVGHFGNHISSQQNGYVFEKESFVKCAQSNSMQQFLEWFTETQMFEVFLAEKVETTNKSKSNTLNIFNSRIKEYNEELEEAKREKKKGKGFLGFLK